SETGVPSTTGAAFRIYAESSSDTQSGVGVANIASTPVTVTFEVSNLDGSATGLPEPITRDVVGFGHLAQFASQLFPTLPNPFKGIIRVSATSPSGISVVGVRSRYNERGDLLMTTTPPVNEAGVVSASELVVPHLVDGSGFTTQFILMSGSSSTSSSGS